MLRPTNHVALCSMYWSWLTFGRRKEDCLILDFLWHTERHELVHPAHLIAKDDEIAKKMTEKMAEVEEDDQLQLFDLEEVAKEAESEVVQDRENSLAEKLATMKKRKRKLVDPLQFELSIQSEEFDKLCTLFWMEMAPASDKQLQHLKNLVSFQKKLKTLGKLKYYLIN
ncbi:hypothetical protein ICE98_03321 [Lactococcus lactis]|nr:hypothetical protein [Lactococcus lactis]